MKLYTEEQVRKAIVLAQECEHECGGVYFNYTEKEIIDELTPIELPSDEEIEKEAQSSYNDPASHLILGFVKGAKWMRDKIQGVNK